MASRSICGSHSINMRFHILSRGNETLPVNTSKTKVASLLDGRSKRANTVCESERSICVPV